MPESEPTGALLDVAEVHAAAPRIAPYLHRTPLIRSTTLSQQFGAEVHLKLECLQKTGSFKPRGAFNKLLGLSDAQRAAGVVGVSGGNHAQGVAYAARCLGSRATICMPKTTPQNYLDATRGYGAEIVLADDIHAAFAACEALQEQGMTMIHPFDDWDVMAGQGTLALEILEDVPELTRIYISIGGGGLIAGMAAVLKAANPAIHIVGVETAGADAMTRSIRAGEIIEMPAITSIARTLGSPRVSERTYRHVEQLVDELVVVEDDATVEALVFLLERTKTLVEPAAACCLAAAWQQQASIGQGEQVALLMCGGNVSVADLKQWSAR
ncbi:threonine ammonia-lyase [Roseimaritima sediminicola]|uniref:threonine ammonia-lyase n=1 Tax=Roseimaritima sediminicola TaxID=2662066 RepID=UPI001298564E|nr:threonine/serine dehydratase [Roseimaritima sediminicola]